MPLGPDNLRASLASLSRRVADLESQLAQREVRAARPGSRRNPRLAITVADSESGYPAFADAPNTYLIRFVDASFTKTQGDQTPTTRDRQAEGNEFAYAHNVNESYVAEGTLIAVFSDLTQSGTRQWWFGYGTASVVYGLVKGAVAAGDASFVMDNVVAMQGASPLVDPADATEELTGVVHLTGLPADDNAPAVAWYDRTSGAWRGIPQFKRYVCP